MAALGGDYARAISQAAFFINRAAPGGEDAIVVDVLRRLLTRGDRPPVDPLVERWVIEAAGWQGSVEANRDPGDASVRLPSGVTRPGRAALQEAIQWRESFDMDDIAATPTGERLIDSPIEEAFLRRALKHRPELGHWLTPQASIGALTGDAQDRRRTDFLVAHPGSAPTAFELDGAQHRSATEVDRDRDATLANAGIEVHRFTRADVDRGGGLAELGGLVVGTKPPDDLQRLVWAPVVANRVARAVVEGIASGVLNGDHWSLEVDEATGVGPTAIRSALEIIASVADVWDEAIAPSTVDVVFADGSARMTKATPYEYEVVDAGAPTEADLVIRIEPFRGPWHRLPTDMGVPTIIVRSAYVPIDLREGRLEGGRRRLVSDAARIDRGSLQRLLVAVFAKREFYPAGTEHPRGQEIAIRRLLGGLDAVVLLPTGAGKSLIYQFAGLLLPGRTLIIDPIVALIDDQIDGLARQGIDRGIGITSADTAAGRTEAKLAALQAGDALFCFVAPERLQQGRFRDAVRALSVASPINVCVIDEAHCVSEWGHDFRTSYLDLGRVLRTTASDVRAQPPPLLALTGTASRSVLRDLLIELDIDRGDPEVIIAPKDFDRPELTFDIIRGNEDETVKRLLGTLQSLPSRFGQTDATFFQPAGADTYSGVVFTQTVNPSRALPDGGVIKLQRLIEGETGAPAGIYAGSRPRDWSGPGWDDAKRRYAAAFKDNELSVLVSTKAYGMGIDKPNIRWIVHVGIPGSIEAYYQEAGRAGRDRRQAHCVIVHDRGGRGFHEFTHEKSFRGHELDVEDVRGLLGIMGPIGERRRVNIPRPRDEDAAEARERAIHRLKLLGVVEDYLVDFGASTFEVVLADVGTGDVDARLIEFVRRTLPGRVPQFEGRLARRPPVDLVRRAEFGAELLITFVYETVVNARRRALEEMVRLADEARDDADMRSRILRYLELGRVAGELEALMDLPRFAFDDWLSLYVQLDTVDDAREWRGATARLLESAPDHPGLLVGRAIAEAIVPGGDQLTFVESLSEGLISARTGYLVDTDDMGSFCEWLVGWLHDRRRQWSAVTMLLAERAIGPGHGRFFEALERRIMTDRRSIPDELGVAVARRVDRDTEILRSLAATAAQLG